MNTAFVSFAIESQEGGCFFNVMRRSGGGECGEVQRGGYRGACVIVCILRTHKTKKKRKKKT
jgi:hypothetical protein